MIGWLKGMLADKHQPGKIVIDVNGVGYDVETSLQTFCQIEHEECISLHIHTVVREDALLLYGFINQQERALFRALIKVNGVGPKMAIAILSSVSPEDFIHCITHQDVKTLTQLPGIGKKTAERLLVEMKGCLEDFSSSTITLETSPYVMRSQEEAIEALEALGYKPQEARKAIKKIDQGTQSSEELIKQALQLLSSHVT